MTLPLRFLLSAMLLAQAAPAAAQTAKTAPKAQRVIAPARPTPRPALRAAAPDISPDIPMDLSKALPVKALAKLPSSADQLQALSSELKQGQPQLASAKEKSAALASEAADLRGRLVATAARIAELERETIDTDQAIAALTAENERLSAGFANDRVAVTRLLAVLQRLQHDMPPALAMRPDDALGAARGAMLIGATLPPVYAQAAALARRIESLKTSRARLESRRRDAAATALRLTAARAELDGLLAQKEKEAETAGASYETLRVRMAATARQASDFQSLLTKVKALRQTGGAEPSVVFVTAQNGGGDNGPARNSLLEPVVGTVVDAGEAGNRGLSYVTRPGAQVIAPSDGKVLYAGPYHKSGQVLILEITSGYDLVLAGLGRVTVKPNDHLLAGEPVGTMAPNGSDNRLYFEMRRGGHGTSPAPWLKLKLRAGL